MVKDVLAAVYRGGSTGLSLETLRLGEPRADEVWVRVVASGVCHTDLNMCRPDAYAPSPIVLGHEGAGVVERVGRAVTKVQPGDHVVMTFDSCGVCPSCAQGDNVYCHNLKRHAFSGGRADGSTGLRKGDEIIHSHFFGQSSFATYSLCTERNVVRVDDSVDLALLGPLGCGIQTGAGAIINSLQVRPGSSVGVFGAGSVGLAAVMAARLVGAAAIVAVDRQPGRLELARALGATHAIDAASEPAFEVLRRALPHGLDYVLDTTGSVPLIREMLMHLKPRGICGLVNTAGGADAHVHILSLVLGGRSLRGIHQGDSKPEVFIPMLIDLYKQGRFPFDRLIRFYDLAQINQAFEDMEAGVTLKPVIRMPGV